MKTVSISKLRAHLSQRLRQVQGGTAVVIIRRGKVVARMVPAQENATDVSEIQAMLVDIDRLAADISAHWPTGVSALDAVDDARRAHECPVGLPISEATQVPILINVRPKV